MKKIRACGALLLVLMVVFVNVFSVSAAEDSKGDLISVDYEYYSDGTYSIERTYVESSENRSNLSAVTRAKTYGTDTFTKEKEWRTGLAGNGTVLATAKVKASFDWNSTTKKVKVYNVSGEVTYSQGTASNKKTATSGNDTSKATATYSFTRKPTFGSETTYSVSVSCNDKGTNS